MSGFKQRIKNMLGSKYVPIIFLIAFNAFCIHLAIPKKIIVEGDNFDGSLSVAADVSGIVDTNVSGDVDARVSGYVSADVSGKVDAEVSQSALETWNVRGN